MSAYSWQNIQRRIKDIKNPIGAEIGVHRGVLSNQLLKNIPDLTLIMIDAWSPDIYNGKGTDAASESAIKIYQEEWFNNYKIAFSVAMDYPHRALILREESLKAVNIFPDNKFDFVFVDAAHDEESVWLDSMNWIRKVKKDGWLCGHDYGGQYEGVKKAVDELFGTQVEADSDFTWFMRKI